MVFMCLTVSHNDQAVKRGHFRSFSDELETRIGPNFQEFNRSISNRQKAYGRSPEGVQKVAEGAGRLWKVVEG